MKLRWIGRVNRREKMVRVCSVLWGTHPKDGGHKRRLSVALWPRLFKFWREYDAWFLTIAGVRVHFKKNDRGVLV